MTLRYRALIIVAIIILVASVGFVSCSPGKQLLNDQQALESIAAAQDKHDDMVAARAIDEYTKNHPCKPMPEINLDSLCGLYFRCPDLRDSTSNQQYRSELAGADQQPPCAGQPKRILVPWEDSRRIDLLTGSCREKDKRLAVLNALISTKDAERIAAVKEAVDDQKAGKKIFIWSTGILGLLLVAVVVISAKKFFS